MGIIFLNPELVYSGFTFLIDNQLVRVLFNSDMVTIAWEVDGIVEADIKFIYIYMYYIYIYYIYIYIYTYIPGSLGGLKK